MDRFSKSSGALLEIKHDFFEQNDKHLKQVEAVNQVYSEQEYREDCKNCEEQVNGFDFESHGIHYSVCDNCGHLNGAYEDSQEFTDYLYSDEGGDNYKENYLKGYDTRVESIYRPKVGFLIDTVGKKSVLDMGCGGGHFVKACELEGLEVEGYDPNLSLISLGIEKEANVYLCEPEEFGDIIAGTDKEVVSMIGVLEHLREPNRAIEAFLESQADYLYISVPLLSLSALLEQANQEVFPRHLSAGHTHLYTKESLEYMANRYGLEPVGQWWFGLDIMDLYRNLLVKSEPQAQWLIRKYLGEHIDKLQSVLDEAKVCSEVHIIFKKR